MGTNTAEAVKSALATAADPGDAVFLQRFFKTGPGEYGEGDVLIGVRVPATRKVCRQFAALPLAELQNLLDSPVHEHRLAGLIIAVGQYKKSSPAGKEALYAWYLENLSRNRINNWDLIDSSCEYIVGEYLMNKPKDILYKLAKSPLLWERRAAIMATFAAIKHGDAAETFKIARMLLHDKADLIHKAVGWMLRETGGRVDRALLLGFLDEHAAVMPRTMLRYAIEKLDPVERAHYMALKTAPK